MPSFYTTHLARIYGLDISTQVAPLFQKLVEKYRGRIPVPAKTSLTESDSFLIVYPDQVHEPGKPHLSSLAEFCELHLRGVTSGVHILPFFPSSSDDGFSIMDFRSVEPSLGTWHEIEELGHTFRLMFDAVINHTSTQGEWFQAFLKGEVPYRDYYLTVEGNPDLSKVVRPRTQPLLTEFQTGSGKRRVWTTFSADQADLNYHNPEVLLEISDILLMYASHGAQLLRLDAIAYLWKEVGTTCIHLPQTHAIIQFLHAMLAEAAPHLQIITETNVTHAENISYFGDGGNEAQLVYNFALPPLLLHTFRTSDTTILSAWVARLVLPSDRTTFFNFLASHDGIGINPVREILSPAAIDALVDQTLQHGGLISYKSNADGSMSPYELNINYFDALSNPSSDEPTGNQIARFMAAQAIMLSLPGVPGIYFHSLFGSRNWTGGLHFEDYPRLINRQKIARAELERQLADPASFRSQVFNRFRHLLAQRTKTAAFHPSGHHEVMDVGRGVFAVLRSSPDGSENVLCLQNITAQSQIVSLPKAVHMLEPYQTIWLANI
jgi:glycosidase